MLCLQELAQEGEREVRTGTRPGVGRVHRACPVCGTSGVQEGIRFFRKPRSCFRICCPTKQRMHPLPPSEGESLKGPVCPLGRSRGQSRGQRGRALEPLHGYPQCVMGRGLGTGLLASQPWLAGLSWVAGVNGGCIVSLPPQPVQSPPQGQVPGTEKQGAPTVSPGNSRESQHNPGGGGWCQGAGPREVTCGRDS